ncbi:MAG: hypothetical protein J3R72DRAFT_418829 [Linnemannia gamsii]|nr:MAG: hypothetical protein J3R72DRAFT_418829 [Linnemannia gamsii]
MKLIALIPALLALSSTVLSSPVETANIASTIEFLCMAGDKIRVGSNNGYQNGFCKTVDAFYDGCSGNLRSSCNGGTWSASYCVGPNSSNSWASINYGPNSFVMKYDPRLSQHHGNHCFSVAIWG